jgi:hypothetical protein
VLFLREIQTAIAEQQLHPKKLEEYNGWSLSHRAELIHSIAGGNFDLGSAIVFDVIYPALNPKAALLPIYNL